MMANSAINVLPLAVGAATTMFFFSNRPFFMASICGGFNFSMPLSFRREITFSGSVNFSMSIG